MQLPTYEELLAGVLGRVGDDVDKREGSLLYTAVAPVCAELAQAYVQLAGALDLAFFDTSEGESLDRLAEQFGVSRKAASAAMCRGIFKNTAGEAFAAPAGMRLGCNGVFYRTAAKVGEGTYQLLCEAAGSEGNQISGELLPVDYLEGFGSAALDGILVAGVAAETDEQLRKRLSERMEAPAFGGNIADYRERVHAIEGVGAVKVTPAANGGGTVKLTLLDSLFGVPTAALVETVRQAADPDSTAAGKGFAPIGHQVTVAAASAKTVNIVAVLTLQSGKTLANVQNEVKNRLELYLFSLRKEWETNLQTVVRISQVTMGILGAEGILDASNVTLNGGAANLGLGSFEVPILGTVTLSTL